MELKKMKSFSIVVENKTEDQILSLPLFDFNLEHAIKVKYSALDENENLISYQDLLNLLEPIRSGENAFNVGLTYLSWSGENSDICNSLTYTEVEEQGRQISMPFFIKIDPNQNLENVTALSVRYRLKKNNQITLQKILPHQSIKVVFVNNDYLQSQNTNL